jgi:PST family polysaccharide transporter
VVSAYVICTFVLFIPGLVYAGRPLDIGAPDVIKVLWRPLTGALMAAAVGEVLRYTMLVHLSEIVRTGVLTLAYVTVYLLIVAGLFRLRSPIRVVLQLMSEYWPARFARGGAIQGFMDEDHQG